MNDSAQPCIVFVSQLGCGGDIWTPVLEHLPDLTTVTYDRPGTGNAPPRPAPNPPLPYSAFAAELTAHLDAENITGPVVLVGHSFGALIARAFTAAHPERVAGLVIVDGSIPQFYVVPTGLPKLDGNGVDATPLDIVTGQVEILRAPVPHCPSLVVTRAYGADNWGSGPERHPAAEDLWELCQQQLAEHWGTTLIIADSSDHQLQREAPALIAYAVRVVHTAVQAGRPVEITAEGLAAVGGRIDS